MIYTSEEIATIRKHPGFKKLVQTEYERLKDRGLLCEDCESFDEFFRQVSVTEYPRSHLIRPDESKPFSRRNHVWVRDIVDRRKLIRFRGEVKTLDQWSAVLNLSPNCISIRLDKGWSMTKIAATPEAVSADLRRESFLYNTERLQESLLKFAKKLV